MLHARRGIVLPAILAVLVALSLLAALALFAAVQEWRVATLAEDRSHARAAALSALASVGAPPSIEGLCLSPATSPQESAATIGGTGSARVTWRHLGGGIVRAEVTGRGRQGARVRLLAHLFPDSTEVSGGLFRCPFARRLVPVGERPFEGHPEG